MENRKMVSRILELQGSAAKSSTLRSQNQEYGKRNASLEEELKNLRNHLKQVEAEKNTFERDIAVYITENRNLKEQLDVMKSAHSDHESAAVGLLQEIRETHKKMMALREAEFESTLKGLKQEIKSNDKSWSEKYKKLESRQQIASGEARNLEEKMNSLNSEVDSYKNKFNTTTKILDSTKQKLMSKTEEITELKKALKEKEDKLTNSEKATAAGSLKSNIQIQALEAKIKKADEDKEQLKKSHKEELQKLQSRLEEREMQLGAQSNVSKRLQNDMRSEAQSLKKELQLETQKSKELNSQIMRMELKLNSANQNLKTSEEERKVKTKYYEEQITVLQKEINSKCAKVDDLQKQLLDSYDANSGDMQELNEKIIVLKKEKREGQNKVVELKEELETTKRNMAKELENIQLIHKQEIEKMKKDFKEKEKHSSAQSCITRKVQDDMKRQVDACKVELDGEKVKNNELNKEMKRLELRLKNAQETAKNFEDDKALKVKLSEEQVSALQQEIAIKNNKLHELQRQLLDAQDMNGKDMEELTEKLASAKREKRTAQNRVTELQEEINTAERQKSKAELNCRTYKEKCDTAALNLVEAEKKIKALEKKVSQLQNDITSNASEKTSLVGELQEKLQHAQYNIRHLEKEKQEKTKLEVKLSRVQNELAIARESKEQVERDLKAELESYEIKLASKEKEHGQYADKLQEKARLEIKLSRIQNELLMTQEKKEKVEKDLKEKLESGEKKLTLRDHDHREEVDKLQESLSEARRALASKNIASVTKCKKVEEDLHRQLQEVEQRKQKEMDRIRQNLQELRNENEDLKEEKCAIEEKFEILRENCSVIETLEEQLDDYHEKCQELQEKNASLIEQLAVTTRERGGANRKVEKYETEKKEQQEKIQEMEKAVETLKQTCVMMEEQIEDLEKFNNQLLKNQEDLSSQKEKVTKESHEMRRKLSEVEHMVVLEKQRGSEKEDVKQEEMIKLQVKAREEANMAQELQDKLSDLERKYNLLEMHTSSLQKKLNAEKETSERLRYDVESTRSRMQSIENIRQQSSAVLRAEIDRADTLAHEKTSLQNVLDTIKMTQSHDAIKMNCTIAQQSKLIDFLQAKVETLEPQDKKKKKKKNDLYQVPLQYRELQDMLEEAKQTNVQLQLKVNNLRTELQETKSHVGRLKHGINGASGPSHTLSPGSLAAITAIVKSPNLSTPNQSGNSRSKPRMHHNIPHRLVENLCTHATKCHVCLDTLRFGRVLLRCTECHATCHVKCRTNLTSACGLPGGLVQHYKQGGKMAAASPVSCISVDGEIGDAQGWLKVLSGGSLWERKWVQLRDGVMIIAGSEKQASLKRSKVENKDREVIDLMQQQGYVHTTVLSNELDHAAKTDLPYVFKLELGPDTSCWPPRSLYFLATGFTDKQKWVAALESITTRNSTPQDTITDSKIMGNKILSLQISEKLEINCSIPISKEKVLFGCDEGLFLLSPSTSSICDRSGMIKVSGMQQVLQMTFLKSPNLIVAIEGTKRRIVTFDVNQLITSNVRSEMSVKLFPVDDLFGCHLFAVGSVEGAPHMCCATAASVQIYRFNTQLGKFMKRKEIATSEPCTCLQFTMCSIIMGTNKFYEVEMKSYKVDEFLDPSDKSLQFGSESFPVSVLQIGQNNGKHEYLLCYHEFGVFVDGFGKRTRKDDITWSRLPLSFAYKHPYLIITHFHSVEILRIAPSRDFDDNLDIQQAFLNLPSPRFLGPAITEGAAYLSANDCGKITVFCCKGNMENLVKSSDNKENKRDGLVYKSCLKRRRMQVAESSQESMDEDVGVSKRQRSPSLDSRSTRFSDTTNLDSNLSTSYDSLLSANTSRWTMGSKQTLFTLESQSSIPKHMQQSFHASCESLDSIGSMSSNMTYRKYSEDDSSGIHSPASSRVMWKPVGNSGKKQAPEKPVRKSKNGTPSKLKFDPVEI